MRIFTKYHSYSIIYLIHLLLVSWFCIYYQIPVDFHIFHCPSPHSESSYLTKHHKKTDVLITICKELHIYVLFKFTFNYRRNNIVTEVFPEFINFGIVLCCQITMSKTEVVKWLDLLQWFSAQIGPWFENIVIFTDVSLKVQFCIF